MLGVWNVNLTTDTRFLVAHHERECPEQADHMLTCKFCGRHWLAIIFLLVGYASVIAFAAKVVLAAFDVVHYMVATQACPMIAVKCKLGSNSMTEPIITLNLKCVSYRNLGGGGYAMRRLKQSAFAASLRFPRDFSVAFCSFGNRFVV